MVKKVSEIDNVRDQLAQMEAQIAVMLPTHITPHRFIRTVMTAIQTTPKLLECVRSSLMAACLKCAQNGLLPDGRQSTIVPRSIKGTLTANFEPGVVGLCIMARNSGQVQTIDAVVVHENDEFDQWTDEKGPHLIHRKNRKDPGPIILTIAYIVTKDGGFYYDEIDMPTMKEIEKVSRASTGPWKGPFKTEMYRKSALKRLMKYRAPSSADLEETYDQDKKTYAAIAEPESKPELPPEKPLSRLKAIVDVKPEPKEQKQIEEKTEKELERESIQEEGKL